MALTVTLNPCVDKTLKIKKYRQYNKNHVEELYATAGGKGLNIARMIYNLGGPCTALCLLGQETGLEIENLLKRDGVSYRKIPISMKNRQVITIHETSCNKQTAFFEPGPEITYEERQLLLEEYKSLVINHQYIILGGAIPNASFKGIYFDMIKIAKKYNKKVILDSYKIGLIEGLKASPFMVKPNEEEASVILGRPLFTDKDAMDAAHVFFQRGIEIVVISQGKKGAIFATKDICLKGYSQDITEVNSVGSGDSLVAGICTGLLQGQTYEESFRLGLAAGTANAANLTISNSTKKEVISYMNGITIEKIK